MDWLEKLLDILMFIIFVLLVIILIWCIWGIWVAIDGGSSGSLSFAEMQCLKITTGLLL